MKPTDVLYYMFHIGEFRSIIQWKVWHDPVHQRDEDNECPSLKTCFGFLNKTSRSFSAVIQELHPDLLVPVALFYLILRGLDTIEDDMTIPLAQKDPLLRNFHDILEQDGWKYLGNGPNEKDRDLLVQFATVIEEFKKIKAPYRAIIRDITQKMGNGMADYCSNAEHNDVGVKTLKDYDLYCHYVAGLVGNGLTRLFVESGLANPVLLDRPHLQESMGLFLQKTNIIRDIKEDIDDKRRFWPKDIWSKHVNRYEDLIKPEYQKEALNCSSEMVLNALRHVNECLFYLAGLKEQSVFNFAAIPQAMAIATLELVFRNPNVFKRNIKITKGEACTIMTKSTTNLRQVSVIFRECVRRIHHKNVYDDPNFLEISIACAKIEQFIESIFPSQDPANLVAANEGLAPLTTEEKVRAAAKAKEAKEDTFWMLVTALGTLVVISSFMFFSAWMVGARFDLAYQEVMKGNFLGPKKPEDAQAIVAAHDGIPAREL